jgi:hypothetical protein
MSLKEKAKEIFPGVAKEDSKFEDDRFSGKTVGKARQQQKRELVLNQMINNANRNKGLGFPVSPEEEWLLNNKGLFL